jgi:PAS domain S-box-containing protein
MMPDVALSLTILGVAGAFLYPVKPARWQRLVVVIAAVVVLAIGIGIGSQALGLDAPFGLLSPAQERAYGGRFSPPTAVALICLAVAILSFDSRPGKRACPSELLLLCSGLVGVTALLAYLFGFPLYQPAGEPVAGSGMPMTAVRLLRASGGMLTLGVAVPAAMSALLTSLGLLMERPDRGLMRVFTAPGPGGVLLRRLSPLAILAPVIFGLIASRMRIAEDAALVFATLTTMTTVSSLLLLAVTAVQVNRIHDKLEESRASARALIEQASDGIFIAGLNGRFIDVNDAGCRMSGYPREEILTKSIPDLIPPEDIERYRSSTTQLVQEGSHIAEWMARRKDGSHLPVEISVKVLPDGRWQGIVRDISKRKGAEEALRLSEAKFSGIVSISADAIISVDEFGRIVLFNEGAEKIFGCESAEVIGASLDTFTPQRFRASVHASIEKFAKGPDTSRRMGTAYGLRCNGEEFPADAAISKLSIGGKCILTVTLRDMTEQKRAESEQRLLAEVGSLLATTLDFEDTLTNIARLVVRELADLCIIDMIEDGDRLRRMRVACRDDANPELPEVLMQMPQDRPRLAGASRDVTQSRLIENVTPSVLRSWSFSEDHLKALEKIAPKSAITVPLMVHGKILGALLMASSDPARRYGPAAVRMAEAIAQRAALSLENARLYRAAKRASQIRDDILGIVAHDLRNPLQLITIFGTKLRRRGPDSVRDIGVEIAFAAARMNRLIQDLLDVTRMEGGHLSVKPGRLRPTAIISALLETELPLAASASLDLRVEAPPDLPDIWADQDRLLQVFENLVGNAIKFTEPGGRITLGAEPRADEVVFSVADTGPGIARGDLPHIFDRFWQASNVARRGAGLGLPIVKGIVEAHGGRVWVESTPGQGSTFYFAIPRAPQVGAPRKTGQQEETVPSMQP